MTNKLFSDLERAIRRLFVVAERHRIHPTLTSAYEINRVSRLSWAILYGQAICDPHPLRRQIQRTIRGHAVCEKVIRFRLRQSTKRREAVKDSVLECVRMRKRFAEVLASQGVRAVVKEIELRLNDENISKAA